MKLRNSTFFSRPWRIREFTGDFRLEDVWALPTPGGPDDFPRLIRMVAAFDQAERRFSPAGTLFAIRRLLGQALGWDEMVDDPNRPSLAQRLPEELRHTRSDVSPAMGFTPLYQLDDEWAAELVNATMHGVVHLGWVPSETGGYRGEMAILVKPNGVLGRAYMAAITPFRYLIVYPQMLKGVRRKWLSQNAEHR